MTSYSEIAKKLLKAIQRLGTEVANDLMEDVGNDLSPAELRKNRKRKYRERLTQTVKNQPAGVPVVLEQSALQLVISERYLNAKTKANNMIGENASSKEIDTIDAALDWWANRIARGKYDSWIVRNCWWSNRLQGIVTIEENWETKKLRVMLQKPVDVKPDMYLGTYMACDAHNIDTEVTAMEKLKTHVTKKQFNRYFVGGMLAEQSKRSGVSYLFRRMRPTLAFRWDGKGYKFLAALCVHPVAYYKNTWCGSLAPTDDVIAHLLMMRADEYGFWKKSTQHPAHVAQANF